MTPRPLLLSAALAVAIAAPALAQNGRAQAVLPGGNAREPVNIEANKLEWFDKDQRAVYSGDVVVMQGESSMRATVLTIFLTGRRKSPPPAPAARQHSDLPAAARSAAWRRAAPSP